MRNSVQVLTSTNAHAYAAAGKRFFGSLIPNVVDHSAARRSLQLGFGSIKKTAVRAMNGIMHSRVIYEKEGGSGIRSSVECFVAVLDQAVPLPNVLAPLHKVFRFKDVWDTDVIPVSSNTKLWMFVFPFVLPLVGVLVWKILDRRKRRFHRAPYQNAPPSVTFDWNNEHQSLQDEDGEPSEESEDAQNNDNEQEENRKEESDTTRVLTDQYYEHTYGSESSTNSGSTYKSAGLPKDVAVCSTTGLGRTWQPSEKNLTP